ncbi:MAG: hypothetical protein RDU14_14245 [Melioribacteraceae bacterium]|nr:hypothetical protein [Melioribacteraceae bacterium]
MSITNVAQLINQIADEEKYNFRFIQYYRTQKYKKRPQTYSPFGAKTIFENEHYAYHSGGRHEIQFNIGRERTNTREFFRYGLAFSLKQGRSLIDPITQFKSRIEFYNQFVTLHPRYFDNILMWYYDGDNIKHEFDQVHEIPDSLISINNFIFIGRIINKTISQIDGKDILTILKFFDYLLALYQYVESFESNSIVEDKIARICWNTNGWIKPSGKDGKSKSESHENTYGYGHEEWLFDFNKIIDGYHYGFLEPINKFHSKYAGNKFNILLYTIDSKANQKYWVGKINNVEVIDILKSSQVIQEYESNGWLEEMKSQLTAIMLDSDTLDNWIGNGQLFNIRFRVADLEKIYSSPIPVAPADARITLNRYNLLNVNNPELPNEDAEDNIDLNTVNDGKHSYSKTKIRKSFHVDIELEQKHNEMSDKFLRYIKDNYPNDIVKRECRSFGARRIDIVRQTSEGNIFYEIKTYNNPLNSLRYALGQIFEYAFYPTHRKAIKLVIVTHRPADDNIKKYIVHLNTIIDIPLEYIYFDLESCTIVT